MVDSVVLFSSNKAAVVSGGFNKASTVVVSGSSKADCAQGSTGARPALASVKPGAPSAGKPGSNACSSVSDMTGQLPGQ